MINFSSFKLFFMYYKYFYNCYRYTFAQQRFCIDNFCEYEKNALMLLDLSLYCRFALLFLSKKFFLSAKMINLLPHPNVTMRIDSRLASCNYPRHGSLTQRSKCTRMESIEERSNIQKSIYQQLTKNRIRPLMDGRGMTI